MKRLGFVEEQIIAMLREHEVGQRRRLCAKQGISGVMFYKRKRKYGGLEDRTAEVAGG